MAVRVETTTDNIPWQRVAGLLAGFGLSEHDGAMQQRIFTNSYSVVFLFDDDLLIGVGRTLSDGVCQAAIYNIALDAAYHGKGLGRLLIGSLVESVNSCNIILYTHPDRVSLYETVGFRRMKTGMARYHPSALARLEEMNFV